jgi:cytoskeletal protein CcmA (bactofilin family)
MAKGADERSAAGRGWVAALARLAADLAGGVASRGRGVSAAARVGGPGRIDTLIGPGTSIRGPIAFSGGLRVDGEVDGDVLALPGSPSVVAIGLEGRLRGEIRAARVLVNGFVTGSIVATDRLELLPGARVSGELRYAALEIHAGAVIDAAARREAPQPAPVTPSPEAERGPDGLAAASPA